jgi:hypothetical protein
MTTAKAKTRNLLLPSPNLLLKQNGLNAKKIKDDCLADIARARIKNARAVVCKDFFANPRSKHAIKIIFRERAVESLIKPKATFSIIGLAAYSSGKKAA